MEAKRYGVLITEEGAAEIAPLVGHLLRKLGNSRYVNCKRINPDGLHYFHMTVEDKLPDGTLVEIELQVPHRFVRAVMYAADLKRLGFTP